MPTSSLPSRSRPSRGGEEEEDEKGWRKGSSVLEKVGKVQVWEHHHAAYLVRNS